jgi:hypothetical protein
MYSIYKKQNEKVKLKEKEGEKRNESDQKQQ